MSSETRTVTVKALVAKRAEIAGKIADLQKQIQAYQDDLVHLDHALRLFDPTISGWDIRAKRPKARTTGYFPTRRALPPDLRIVSRSGMGERCGDRRQGDARQAAFGQGYPRDLHRQLPRSAWAVAASRQAGESQRSRRVGAMEAGRRLAGRLSVV